MKYNEWRAQHVDGGDGDGIIKIYERQPTNMEIEQMRESGILINAEKSLLKGLDEFKGHI
ncbi:MAG: hypothetical protein FWH01_02285 [Oscillospiraceae bacterium]|nr:hypothetical protein [Oscillospiraceae bacterium]